jgi:Tfp pilus assembly protein PilZ
VALLTDRLSCMLLCMGEEQRRSPRRSLDVEVNFAFNAIAHTKDISAGGICLITDRELEETKLFRLNFFLPDEAEPVELYGKVVWSRPAGEHHYESGVSFWKVDSVTTERLESFLKESPV